MRVSCAKGVAFAFAWVWGAVSFTCQWSKGRKKERNSHTPLIKKLLQKSNQGRRVHTLGFFTAGTLMFFPFLLTVEGLALAKSFKVRSPWEIGGISTCWDPFSPKFLTRSLIPNHHVLNLGEGNPTFDGEARVTLELGTNTLIRFPLLKAKDMSMPHGGRPPIAVTLVCPKGIHKHVCVGLRAWVLWKRVDFWCVTRDESILMKLPKVSEVATNHWVYSKLWFDFITNPRLKRPFFII